MNLPYPLFFKFLGTIFSSKASLKILFLLSFSSFSISSKVLLSSIKGYDLIILFPISEIAENISFSFLTSVSFPLLTKEELKGELNFNSFTLSNSIP